MRTVILTGGSEVISTALVEALSQTKTSMAIVSLVPGSILRNAIPGTPYAELDWPPKNSQSAAEQLIRVLAGWGAGPEKPWSIFPTEDGGLRLLLEQKKRIETVGRFCHAQSLQLGGLDKAELFNWLDQQGHSSIIAPTQIVSSPQELREAINFLGGDCVIKPALKPLSMQLTGMPAKAFMTKDFDDLTALCKVLTAAWSLSSRWVVQTRLETPAIGEAVFWGVRDASGHISGITAVERMKQPKYGGTGCWVETKNSLFDRLLPPARTILNAINFIGICELEFLVDAAGQFRLLELNSRPWLQIGLTQAAGAPLVSMAAHVLQGSEVEPVAPRDKANWINIERLLVASLSGEQGPRFKTLRHSLRIIRDADTVAIYSSPLPHVKFRWLWKMTCKAVRRLRS